MYAKMNTDIYGEGKETKRKATEKVEEQHIGVIRRNWSRLGADI